VVKVPPSRTPGPVTVKVRNPDEGKDRLVEGYIYLSKKEGARAHPESISGRHSRERGQRRSHPRHFIRQQSARGQTQRRP
jgi:hypothetical protein